MIIYFVITQTNPGLCIYNSSSTADCVLQTIIGLGTEQRKSKGLIIMSPSDIQKVLGVSPGPSAIS